jgi:hypothetical protein
MSGFLIWALPFLVCALPLHLSYIYVWRLPHNFLLCLRSYFVLIICDWSNRSGHSAQGLRVTYWQHGLKWNEWLSRNGRFLTVLELWGDLSRASLFIFTRSYVWLWLRKLHTWTDTERPSRGWSHFCYVFATLKAHLGKVIMFLFPLLHVITLPWLMEYGEPSAPV